jgi:cytochrome c-type protein NapC
MATMQKEKSGGRLRRFFTSPSTRWGVGSVLALGILAGAAAWAGFTRFVDATSDPAMCHSCHEMREFIFPEYEQSAHYLSRSGVRPMCADCHVPHGFFAKMGAKIRATAIEIPSHLAGNIDTREKFEAKREELAHRVWARYEANDSAPCRHCHEVTAMDPEAQALGAVREHEAGFAEGKTCIDCHKGIAHQLPASMLEKEEEEIDFDF